MTAELLMEKTSSRGRVRSAWTHVSTGNAVQTYVHTSRHRADTMVQFEAFEFIHFQRSQADPKVFNTTSEQIGDRDGGWICFDL